MLPSESAFSGGSGGGGGIDRPRSLNINYSNNDHSGWISFEELDQSSAKLEIDQRKRQIRIRLPEGCMTTYSTPEKAAAMCPGFMVVRVFGGTPGYTCQCREDRDEKEFPSGN
jgi:hypothetical protein